MKLTTDRLTLRPFNQGDLDDVFEFYSNDQVCQYLLEDPWQDQDREEKFQEKLNNHSLDKESALNLAVLLDNTVIGDISVWYTDMKDTVELGYVFHPSYSGLGYAREAVRAVIIELFSTFQVHRIQANLDARNTASANLCQKLGMRREAHFLQDFWNKGEWTDSYVYGMLESDL
jgi:RimJ/RimL family protein N-acetyltransferase